MLSTRFSGLIGDARVITCLLVITLLQLPAFAQDGYQPTVMITGSNRGIGFEFAQQYAAKGWRVIATARRPESAADLKGLQNQYPNLSIEQLDATNETDIRELAVKYSQHPIDVLINNAGVIGPDTTLDDDFSAEEFSATLAINSFAPLRISQAFLGSVSASRQKKIVVITSGLGSIQVAPEVPHPGPFSGHYFYKISKAAVNMAMRILHAQLRESGIHVGIMAPGAVVTDMLASTSFDLDTALTQSESVGALIGLIDALDAERSGRYFRYDGSGAPW
jgi:NAD(P)-dependent dehydrogenase (short-subunit alcohol dehydrogenase family)